MNLGAGIRLLFSFVSARGLQFLAPILVANLMPRADYGTVEFAHATATLLAALLGCGMAALVPIVVVQHDRRYALHTLLAHHVLVTGLAAACAAVLFVWLDSTAARLAALFSAALVMQVYWTYLLRSRGRANASLYLEVSPFAAVLAAAAASWLLLPQASLALVQGALAALVVAFMAASLIALRNMPRPQAGQLGHLATLGAGAPLMLAGLLAVLVTTSGRLGADLFGGRDMTGAFAALSRVALLPMVVHQLFNVARFRELFALPADRFAVLLAWGMGLLVAAATLLVMLLPWLGAAAGAAFQAAASEHPVAASLMVAQSVLWSGIAQNDLICTRLGLMQRVLPWTMLVTLSALAVVAARLSAVPPDLTTYVVWHSVLMGVLFVSQCIVIGRCGKPHTRFWVMTAAGYAAVLAAGLAMARVAGLA